MNRILKENVVKNSVVLILILLAYFQINSFLRSSQAIIQNEFTAEILIVFVSIISAAACTGNFAFTYEKINPSSIFQRFLAHTTTGLLMLVIGISFGMISVLVDLMIEQQFILLNVCLALLYISSVLYDFWDLYRIKL